MSKRRWTKREEYLLIRLIKRRKNIKEISKILNRTEKAVKHRLTKLRKSKDNVPYLRRYNEDDSDFLTSFSNDPEGDSPEYIASYLGRSRNSVNSKLHRMRKSKHVNLIQRRWSLEEDKILMNAKGNLTYEELGKKLNRSRSAVNHRAQTLGIANKKRDFSKIGYEIKKLASEGYTRKEIAEKLNLKYSQVRNYIYRKNIACKKSDTNKTENQKRHHSNFMKLATRKNN